MLRHCSGVRILATSREGLGVSGEALHVIPPLAVPAPGAQTSLPELLRFEAVRLFVERATTVVADFVATERNAGAVIEVCRRLDGIPLAIELAAARTNAMAVEEIAARIDDRFRLLTGGSRTALPRHQTLRGVLDWSHQLLTDGERILLRRLSAFAGGFTLDAAERVGAGGKVGGDEVAHLLARLVERSLVVFESASAEPRYRLLETIRQYAQAKLVEAGEADVVRSVHLDYYVEFAERADAHLRGPGQMAWLARLASEHDNFRSALGWSVAHPERAHAGTRLAATLQWFWFIRGPVDEGRHWLDRSLSADIDAEPAIRARALAGLGMLAWRADDFAQAQRALAEGVTLARALGDDSTLAFALHHLAHVVLMVSDLPRAMDLFDESVSRFRSNGDPWGTAWSLRCQGDNMRGQGMTAPAVARLEESLTLFRKVADRWLIGHVLVSLGAIAREQADYARAKALLDESVAIWREAADVYDIAGARRELGNVARCERDHERATGHYAAALAAFREIGDRYETGRTLECLAALALDHGDARRAAKLLGAADALRVAIGATVRPVDRTEHDRTVAAARIALGAGAFEAAFADGRASSVDEVASVPSARVARQT